MRNINTSLSAKQNALASIDKYIDLTSGHGTVNLSEAVLGLLPGATVLEWEVSALFARDRIQQLRDSLLISEVSGIDRDEVLSLLTSWISFYEEIHFEPLRRAEIERCVIEIFTRDEDDSLEDITELYEMRTRAFELERKMLHRQQEKEKRKAA